jgi:hypothetical protein
MPADRKPGVGQRYVHPSQEHQDRAMDLYVAGFESRKEALLV